jgi:putative ABC transport system permease protein
MPDLAAVALVSGSVLSGFGAFWIAAAALAGALLAAAAMLIPAWSDSRRSTVVAARALVGRHATPLWQRVYLDVIFVLIAALVFWRTASSGYQVVLAPEGVAQSSVEYQAFVAPIFLWIGMGLLTLRLWNTGLERGRKTLGEMLRLLARELSRIVAASLSRERWRVTRGVVFVALAEQPEPTRPKSFCSERRAIPSPPEPGPWSPPFRARR